MTEATENLTPLQHVELNMARRIQFMVDGWTEQAAEARAAVARNDNSDWALMEELGKSYGYAPMVFSLTRHMEYVQNGHGTWLETLTKLRDSLLRDMMSARVSNSTSGASNLISVYKLEAIQKTYDAVAGWVTVLNAAQPAK